VVIKVEVKQMDLLVDLGVGQVERGLIVTLAGMAPGDKVTKVAVQVMYLVLVVAVVAVLVEQVEMQQHIKLEQAVQDQVLLLPEFQLRMLVVVAVDVFQMERQVPEGLVLADLDQTTLLDLKGLIIKVEEVGVAVVVAQTEAMVVRA
jgi:hypothetical protein